MRKERKFNVGDRLPDNFMGGGWVVVDTSLAKHGAIGIRNDTPEYAQRVQKALEDYAVAVREDQLRPRTDIPDPRFWYEPVFDSSK